MLRACGPWAGTARAGWFCEKLEKARGRGPPRWASGSTSWPAARPGGAAGRRVEAASVGEAEALGPGDGVGAEAGAAGIGQKVS